MSNLSNSAFKAVKYFLGTKLDASTLLACFNSFLVA